MPKKTKPANNWARGKNALILFFVNCTCSELLHCNSWFDVTSKMAQPRKSIRSQSSWCWVCYTILTTVEASRRQVASFNMSKKRLHPTCIIVQYSSGPEKQHNNRSRYAPHVYLPLSTFSTCRLDLVLIWWGAEGEHRYIITSLRLQSWYKDTAM